MKEITIENLTYSNVKCWIKDFDHKQKVEFAVYCAELVIDLYAGSSDSPRKAIQSAKDWLLNPSNENKNKCRDSADAANAAAYAADAADAADAAAYAANAAAYAADAAYAYAAAYAADADAAAYAAYAAYAADAAAYAAANAAANAADAADAADASKNTTKEKIVNYIKSKLEKPRTKEAYEPCEYGDKQSNKVYDFEQGKELFRCFMSDRAYNYVKIETLEEIFNSIIEDEPLYVRVTKPIEWWEDAVEFAQHGEDMASQYNEDSNSIYLCGTFSREEACDFARILLEQGE